MQKKDGFYDSMTAIRVIEEIKRLPGAERLKVVAFARQAEENAPLTPEELGQLAKRMAETDDPVEAGRLEQEIVRGFYGGESHA